MTPDTAPPPRRGPSLAGVLLATAREALGVEPQEMAAAAGCDEDLLRHIESGDLDPTMDTVERILNGSGLELRCGPGPPSRRYSGPLVDGGEVARLCSELAAARAFRREIGAPPPGPPAGALPDWDGADPAPPRPFGADEGRSSGGGWAALAVGLARVTAQAAPASFADSCGISRSRLDLIESGHTRPTVGELAEMLAAAGEGLRVRIEVYDDHDDGLHLSARTDPELHRPQRAAPRRAEAPTRS